MHMPLKITPSSVTACARIACSTFLICLTSTNRMAFSAPLSYILTSAVLAAGVSAAVALLLVLTRRWHVRLSGDSLLHMPQKIHEGDIPRIGGLAVMAGFVAGLVHLVWFGAAPPAVSPETAGLLLLGLAPIAIAGFGEDLTKRVGPRARLLWMAAGSAIAMGSMKLALERLGSPLLDPLMTSATVAFVFSAFACVGVTNAFNLIDGLNGLLAGVSLITLAAIAWVAASLGDQTVFALAVLLAVAILGWLPFNWPRARLFAGDGGAYSIGFLSALLVLLLIKRHEQVSPWFGLAVLALPVWETLYSIWRRSRTGLAAMEPDQSHLHQLVRLRLHWARKYAQLRRAGVWSADWTPMAQTEKPMPVRAPNGSCSPLLWGLHAIAACGGALAYDSTPWLAVLVTGFAAIYVALHRRLLRARTKYKLSLAA
jgi:UDP-N-acetylmuramyl pentapeptide phosphotransferase/UDP-N-acetylglucosamine-1-phosphate transferase